MTVDVERLQSLALSADEIRQLTGWGDAMVTDYLSILQGLLEIGDTVDITDIDVTDHIDNDLIHFTQAAIDHTQIQGVGEYEHGVIDSHIDNEDLHYPQTSIDHNIIANKGINTHAQIDAALVPVGAIVMYSGAFSAIPATWQLCDGTNGTPDMTDMFVVGTNTEGQLESTGDMADDTTPDGTFDWIKLAFIMRMS